MFIGNIMIFICLFSTLYHSSVLKADVWVVQSGMGKLWHYGEKKKLHHVASVYWWCMLGNMLLTYIFCSKRFIYRYKNILIVKWLSG